MATNDQHQPRPTTSANGRALQVYQEAAYALLGRLTLESYYSADLPSPADDALADIVGAFTAWPMADRDTFVSHLPADKQGIFGIFGHRAATLAVRSEDPERLRLGLIGNVIANSPIPPHRKVDAALAVFYHCANRLGIPTKDLFEDAARFATEDMAPVLIAFGQRENVNIKQYGWREIKTPEGIRYIVEW